MLEKVRGLIVFSVMTALVLAALRFLSWIPEVVRDGTLRRFESLEQAKAHLKIKRMFLPAFYPPSIVWPPILVAGQTSPYPALITEFSGKGTEGVYLAITQTARPRPPLRERISMASIREQVRYPFKDRTALLEVGTCAGGEACSRFRWEEGPFDISLIMKSTPMELVRMAESMIPRETIDGHGKDEF